MLAKMTRSFVSVLREAHVLCVAPAPIHDSLKDFCELRSLAASAAMETDFPRLSIVTPRGLKKAVKVDNVLANVRPACALNLKLCQLAEKYYCRPKFR